MTLQPKWHWILSLIAGISLAGAAGGPAAAAEQVVLKYKIFQRSLPVADLTALAETGETSRPLRNYIRTANQDPEKVRQTLTDEVEVNPVTLDRVLNSPLGDVVLGQLGQYIYTSSRREDERALRAALTLSASDDGQVNLLEVMQNYPTQEVYVDTEQLAEAFQSLRDISDRLGDVFGVGDGLGLF